MKLKAPKGQRNSFGNYNYRSCEDIVEAVKPLLPEGMVLLLDDEIVNVGAFNYIKATASLRSDDGEFIYATGWAREAVTKKSMDDSQITGATSSYARKYALNGLFAIDDTKDHDTNERKKENDKRDDEEKLKNATDFVDSYLKQLVDVKTQDELLTLQTKNAAALEKIRKNYQNLNEHVIKITKELKLEG